MRKLRPALVALSLLVAAGLAGCLSGSSAAPDSALDAPTPADADESPPNAPDPVDPDPDAPDAEADPVAPARVETVTLNGTLTGASPTIEGTLCCAWIKLDGENHRGTFAADGATGIVVELVWADATADLDLGLFAPDFEDLLPPEANGTQLEFSRGHAWIDYDGRTGAPDAHATIVVTEPELLALQGDWSWSVGTKGGHAVPFAVHVSVFYGQTPAEGWSAVAPA